MGRDVILTSIITQYRPMAVTLFQRWLRFSDPMLADDLAQEWSLRMMDQHSISSDSRFQEALTLRLASYVWRTHWQTTHAAKRGGSDQSISLDSIVGTMWEPETTQSVYQDVANREMMAALSTAWQAIDQSDRVAITAMMDRTDDSPHRARIARRHINAAMDNQGYPFVYADRPPYPRDRSEQMQDYNRTAQRWKVAREKKKAV